FVWIVRIPFPSFPRKRESSAPPPPGFRLALAIASLAGTTVQNAFRLRSRLKHVKTTRVPLQPGENAQRSNQTDRRSRAGCDDRCRRHGRVSENEAQAICAAPLDFSQGGARTEGNSSAQGRSLDRRR